MFLNYTKLCIWKIKTKGILNKVLVIDDDVIIKIP
jgi:hypothetical protein